MISTDLINEISKEYILPVPVGNGFNSRIPEFSCPDNCRDVLIFEDFNRAAERIVHDQRERLIGKSIFKVCPGVEQFGLIEVFRQVWQTDEPACHPVTLYKDDKLSGWHENFVYKLPSGKIVAVFEDIAERKRAEEEIRQKAKELQEKNDELNRFIYAVSHDHRVDRMIVHGWNMDIKTVHQHAADNPILDPPPERRAVSERLLNVVSHLRPPFRILRLPDDRA